MELIGGVECISIKEYAEKKGISVSAVNQSLRGKRNQALLKDHLYREGSGRGSKIWLDSEAVRILDANRQNNPVVIDSVESQKQHEAELQKKDARIAELEETVKRLSEGVQSMSKTIENLSASKNALEDKASKVDHLTLQLADSKKEVLAAEQRAEQAEEKVERLKNRSLWQRIRNTDI